MAILNKALTRPAALFGVPLVPLVIVFSLIVIIAVYSHFYWCLFLLIPALTEMRSKARKDIHYFNLKLIAFKTRGKREINKYFAANTIISGQYEKIDITGFNEKMRLNESVSIAKYIPYSTHIHENVVKKKKGDLVATWELGGTIFECEDEQHLDIMTMQLNNLVRSFEGLPSTGSEKAIKTPLILTPAFHFPTRLQTFTNSLSIQNLFAGVVYSLPPAISP